MRASAAVTQAQYNADANTCASLGTTTLTPTILTPTFNIRSSSDPIALANDLTGCTTLFGPTAKSYRISGVGLLIVRARVEAPQRLSAPSRSWDYRQTLRHQGK